MFDVEWSNPSRYLRPAQADDAVLLGLEELLLFEDKDEGDADVDGLLLDGEDGDCLDDGMGEEEKKTGEAGIWPKERDGGQKEVSADAMGISNSIGQVADACTKGAVALQGKVGGEKRPGDGDPGENGIIAGERVGPAQSSKLDELERENNQLREVLEEMQRKMERASRLLRGLVGGGDQDGRGDGDASDGAKGASSVSVGGVSSLGHVRLVDVPRLFRVFVTFLKKFVGDDYDEIRCQRLDSKYDSSEGHYVCGRCTSSALYACLSKG